MSRIYNPWESENIESLFSYREKILQEAFEELGERKTKLIVLRKLERLSNESIAERLNISPGKVNSEVFKAFLKLKKIVDRIQKSKPCI